MRDSNSSPSSSPSFLSSSCPSYLSDLLNSSTSPYSSYLNFTPSSSSPSSSSFPAMTDLLSSISSSPTFSFSSSPSYFDSSSSSSSFPAMTDLLSSISSSPFLSFPSSPSTSDFVNSSTFSPYSSLFNSAFPSPSNPPSSSSSSPPPPSSSASSSSSPPPPSSSSSSSSSSSFQFSSVPSYFDLLNSSTSSSPYSSFFDFTHPSFSCSPSSTSSSSPSSSIENLLSSYSYPSINEILSSSSHLSPTDMLSSYISSMNPSSVATSPVNESRWEYDVFVSFRGEDTRNSFASHLFYALGQEGYTCFRDNDKQSKGMVIESKLFDAIRHSMVALVLFSENYADSRWCLKELAEILECHRRSKEDGHLILPIFYDVEPGEVRKQSGKFGEGFERCIKAINWDATLIDSWKGALVEAGNLSGWHLWNDSNGDEANFIRNIVSQLGSMRLPAKRRKQLAIQQATMRKFNAFSVGVAQIDAIEAAAPKRNMNEMVQAAEKRGAAYFQLAGLINNPEFVDKLLNESSNKK